MSTWAAALELLGEGAERDELEDRLRHVPPSAASRGMYLRGVERTLAEHGRLDEYRRVFGPDRPPAFGFVPLHEYLPRTAGAAVILCGPERVREGLELIGRNNAPAVTRSLLGKALLRIVSPDPSTLLRQGAAAQRQTTTYGHWRLEERGRGHAIMHFRDEWVWIDSLLVGAARGTFVMAGVPAQVECELDDRFNGRHLLRWQPR